MTKVQEFITLHDLADELGVEWSNFRKFVRKNEEKMQINVSRARTEKSRGQKTLVVSLEDADRIRDERERQGFTSSSPSPVIDSGMGNFYIVVADPEMRPNRVKFGYTANVEGRLSDYRTMNPDAKVYGVWECLPTWEAAAIAACSTLPNSKLVGGEVYDVESVDELYERAEQFFAMMP